MLKIVIAMDSFKGSLTSLQACDLIERGFQAILPGLFTVKVPISDGGEGMVEAFLQAVGGEKIEIEVSDPLFRKIPSFYGILPDGKTAVVEMAAASGLPLVEGEENPRLTSTYGTGELILDALDRGCSKFIVGLGGSATTDGGIGMAAALGVKFLDSRDRPISLNGEGLENLQRIDLGSKDPRLANCEFLAACDVDNPLYGEKGAAYVFSPQKGADQQMVHYLDLNLRNYGAVLKRDLGVEVAQLPGAGAAGGLGAGLVAFVQAELKAGIEIILDQTGFDELIQDAHLVITGEGKIDGQSLHGKAPVGIAERAGRLGIPVIAIVGDVGEETEELYERGIGAIFSINRLAIPFSAARFRSQQDLFDLSKDLARFLKIVSDFPVQRPTKL